MRPHWLIAASITVLGFTPAAALDDKVAHPLAVTGRALEILLSQTGGTASSPYRGLVTYFNPPFLRPPERDGRQYVEGESPLVLANLVLRGTAGTIMEDSGVVFGQGRWLWHFYDPFLSSPGLMGFASAFERARDVLWPEAINLHDYSDTARAFAYYRLGQVLHLLEDMASPAHVHNDKHPAGEAFDGPVLDRAWGTTKGTLLSN